MPVWRFVSDSEDEEDGGCVDVWPRLQDAKVQLTVEQFLYIHTEKHFIKRAGTVQSQVCSSLRLGVGAISVGQEIWVRVGLRLGFLAFKLLLDPRFRHGLPFDGPFDAVGGEGSPCGLLVTWHQ